jgi:hypothetical protein
MFQRLAVAVALVAATAVPGLAADVAGKWQGTVQGDQGAFTLVFDFTVEGETLGGTVDGPGGQLPITKGTIKGDDLTFDVDLDAGTTITHEAKVTGDTIAVKATGPWGTSEYTLKRAENQE